MVSSRWRRPAGGGGRQATGAGRIIGEVLAGGKQAMGLRGSEMSQVMRVIREGGLADGGPTPFRGFATILHKAAEG